MPAKEYDRPHPSPPGSEALLSRMRSDELKRSADLAPVSNAAVQALELERAGCTDPLRLVEFLQSDAVIVAQVMRLVNSAALGLRSPVTTLERAGVQLGVRRLAAVAMTVAVAQRHAARGFLESSGADFLWRRSLAIALAAQDDAEVGGDLDPAWAYTLGLFEGLGLLWLLQRLPERLLLGVVRRVATDGNLDEAERGELGASHVELSARLLDTWGLPSDFARGLCSVDGSDASGAELPLKRCLHRARELAPPLLEGLGIEAGPLDWTVRIHEAEPASPASLSRLRADLRREFRAA